MTTITERVAAGAAFLDEHDPDWWRADVDRAIDLDVLELADSRVCILGQRCPLETLADYDHVSVDELPEDADVDRYYAFGQALRLAEDDPRPLYYWAAERGFNSDSGQWNDLTAEWKRVITERRAS